MNDQLPEATLLPRRHPVLCLLCAFPVAGFPAALAADAAYAGTANIMWADFADWLLAGTMLMSTLAAVAGLLVLISGRHRPRTRPVGAIIVGALLVLLLGFLDNLVHSRDAWTSVVPSGLALSALTTIVVLITLWLVEGTRRAVTVRNAEVQA